MPETESLNRSISGQALRDNCLFLLFVILTRFWSESRSLKQLQVTSCKLNKKGYPLSVHRSPRIIGSSFQSKYLFFVLGQSTTRRRIGSEVRGMRLEVRRSRSLRSSDLLPLTSSSSQGRVHDLGRVTKDGSPQRSAGSRS